MLDRYGEDGFQSCEGFDDWSTFSSTDWTEPQQDGSGFSDWGAFQDNTRKEESSTLLEEEAGTFKFPKNVCSVVLHIFFCGCMTKLIYRSKSDVLSNCCTCVIVVFDTCVSQTENGEKGNPWVIFNDCFQVERAENDPAVMEIPTLSVLQQSTLDKPSQSAAISRYLSMAFVTVHYEIMNAVAMRLHLASIFLTGVEGFK